MGALHPDRPGIEALGPALGGREATRPHAVRDRRVRHDWAAGEVLPCPRQRARDGVQRGRGGHDRATRQGGGLHREGGPPEASRGRAGRRHVLADRGRPPLPFRREALHARPRADPHTVRQADRRPPRTRVVRDERRRRAVRGQAHPHGLSPAGACGGGREAGGRVHGRALRGDSRRSRGDPAFRSREFANSFVRVLATIKRVPITGGRIVLSDDSRAIDTRHLGFTMSPHEECGVEEAVRIIEANKGDSVVLTLGPPEAVEQLRDAMALGIDRAIHLQTDGQEWDGEATAAALTVAIRADEAAHGPFDIIFFGNESADSGGFQVGIRVAYALGRPCVTGLKKVTLEGAGVRCEQEVEGGRDVYEVPLPAVLTVKEGLNLPRYPSVPGKMRARSQPAGLSTPPRPAPRLELMRLAVPAGQGRRAESLGSGAPAAPAVVDLLQKAGVL